MGGGGWSFLTLMFVYVTARVARLAGVKYSWRLLWSVLLFFLASQFMLGGGAFLLGHIRHSKVWGFTWGAFSTYDAPHMWALAIALTVAFADSVKIPSVLSKLACFFAPSMFSVYLLHHNAVLSQYLYIKPERWMEASLHLHPMLNIFIAAAFCFAICLALDLVRRLAVKPFLPRMDSFLSGVDERWKSMTLERKR